MRIKICSHSLSDMREQSNTSNNRESFFTIPWPCNSEIKLGKVNKDLLEWNCPFVNIGTIRIRWFWPTIWSPANKNYSAKSFNWSKNLRKLPQLGFSDLNVSPTGFFYLSYIGWGFYCGDIKVWGWAKAPKNIKSIQKSHSSKQSKKFFSL